jgi:hypothetical protein
MPRLSASANSESQVGFESSVALLVSGCWADAHKRILTGKSERPVCKTAAVIRPLSLIDRFQSQANSERGQT